MASEESRLVPVNDLVSFMSQSREVFDETELQRLSDDIKCRGQLQAGLAWHDAARDQLVLICGERRWRAIKIAGLPTMAVKVIEGELTLGQLLALNLSENLQRASLNAIERGKAFQRLMQLESLTASQVAERMHCSNATVSRDLSLLDLSAELQAKVASGKLAASVGALIARISDAEIRRELTEQYVSGSVGRSGIAAAVKQRLKKGAKAKTGRSKTAKPCDFVCSFGAVTIAISSAEPVSWEALLPAIERLQKEAVRLREGGEPTAALPRLFRAS